MTNLFHFSMNNENDTSWTQIESLGIGRFITIALGLGNNISWYSYCSPLQYHYLKITGQ